ncbi:MAG: Rieske (2Fe-2S) protein [Rhodococcus sp. (in: high G+C Gram-positive bacteria)]|uniref:QcrA and Rieske domain-containing protein n=1 Tax=Rhodococcus sp. TaxID=1831 RepID=UPI002AD61984|nr:Rieske (2Fe-2S) protein [Rhodococcus sp. (in: high G+C Gram-positive bacteria)]
MTQPGEGLFRAFSAVCTHQGCTVAEIKDGTINCPCHGSKYSIFDGSVVERPAQKPLHEYTFSLTADTIRVN